MITQGPFDLTIGTTLPLSDPGANSNNPATAVQLQNASPFIIEVNSGGNLLTIQSFTAQTITTSGGGQQMSVEPIQANSGQLITYPTALTVVWLLGGESSPMTDGALTAAAILFAQSNIGPFDNVNVRSAESDGIAAGASGNVVPTAAGSYKILNWGIISFTSTTGTADAAVPIGVLPTYHTVDTVSPQSPSSNRIAGLVVKSDGTHAGLEVTNNTDQTVDVFALFVPL